MPEKWTTLDQQVLIDRWWMTLRSDRVRLPDGEVVPEFHVIEYPDWALTIPSTGDGRLVMVEQYRYGIDEVVLEFPAGAIDPGEAREAAARRELLEETGYAAEEWTHLGSCAPEPSKHTNYAHLFFARRARRVRQPELEVTEDLQIRLLPIDEVRRLAARGEMKHGIHLTALFWALEKGLLGASERQF